MSQKLLDDVPVNTVESFLEVDKLKFMYNGVCHGVDCSIIIFRDAI